MIRYLLCILTLLPFSAELNAQSHWHWDFHPDLVREEYLLPVAGHPAAAAHMPEFSLVADYSVALFDGRNHALLISDRIDTLQLPARDMTVAGWVMVDYPQSWGGFLSVMQDNGDYEKGWVFGYMNDRFSFGLSTEGANQDETGTMTYLESATPFEFGRWYHVAATYNGEVMRLYVNGNRSAESRAQTGAIYYPQSTWFALGAYRDDDENNRLSGGMHRMQLWDRELTPEEIMADYRSGRDLSLAEPTPRIAMDELLIYPYLKNVTGSHAQVRWMSHRPSSGMVEYGVHGDSLHHRAVSEEEADFQFVTLPELEAGQTYFYRVHIDLNDGSRWSSDLLTFQTMVPARHAVSFSIIGDTQNNPAVWGTISEHLWAERPQFIVHAGDIVSPGNDIFKWIFEFFAPARSLLERVPVFGVLGNHERNAGEYYKLTGYPDPGYYYAFDAGDIRFFMIDTNKDVTAGTEQYLWLDEQLAASPARWNIVVHHHPPYSSDENDYGDTWTGTSTRGHLRLRDLAGLYERHGVPLVISGHIHTYERTWPIYEGRVDTDGGVTYVITGGAGGPLENPSPTRSWFSRKVYRGHHYNMAHVFGNSLEWITYDINGNILDQFELHLPD
ncbi:MAG: putative phosphohydrolase [Bacteroidetes bacterium HLUCCA01]|nr:MAG: putative phosphohydrolase [Bacteroidetes bacterium HLUCCA01]